MDNREVTLPNPTMLKTEKESIRPTTNFVEEAEVELPRGKSVVKTGTDAITAGRDDSKEIMMNAKKIFVERFENASVEQKQSAVTQFYNALDSVYKVTYRGAPVPLVSSKNCEGYAFNHDGYIQIPLDILEKQSPDKAAYSILHEYRHIMQKSLNIYSSVSSELGLHPFTSLGHDILTEEIDATKFVFANMDSLGLDKTKIDRYNDWQKAIRITDTFDLLKQNYNQETADNMLDIYKLLDEYTFQTTRSDLASDVIREKFNKIRAKIRFKSNITIAKAKFTELEKIAKLTNDSFLLKVALEVRTDWSQFHL